MKKFMFMLTSIFIFLISVNIYAAEVGPDGSFNHSIDIALPPGTAGLTPKLSLSYNSNSGNGIVGQGWSLEGLPFITRDPSRGIKYDSTDTYTGYNGALIKQADGTYHFQYENYSKIEMHGSAANPDYWVETRSDGTKYYYGTYDNSSNAESANVKALDGKDRQVDSKVRVWALSKVLDTHGNYYTVEYDQDSGEFYPVRIIYTQRGNINFRLRVIDFEYDDSRKDFFTQYINSAPVKTKLRLKSIAVKVNVLQFFNYPITIFGDTVREYTLVYNDESELINSMLQRIEVNDSSGINIEKISFNWSYSSGSIDFYPQSSFNLTNELIISKKIEGDFNGDGRTDFIRLKNIIQKNALFISNGNGTFLKAGSFNLADMDLAPDDSDLTSEDETCGTLAGDYNGDGKTDLLRWQYNSSNNKLYFSDGDGSFTESGNFNIECLFSNNGIGSGGVITGDYNGDGRTDILRWCEFAGFSVLYISNGNGSFTKSTKFNLTDVSFVSSEDEYGTLTGDFNGDGRTDLLRWQYNSSSNKLYFSNGDGSFAESGNFNIEETLFSTNGLGSGGVITGDYNGDGRTDLLRWYDFLGLSYIYISNGNGSFTIPTKFDLINLSFVSSENKYGSFTGDFNGDGRTDLLRWDETYTNNALYISEGDGDFKVSSSFNIKDTYLFNSRSSINAVIGDFNGDGRTDIIRGHPTCSKNMLYFSKVKSPEKIVSITNETSGNIVNIKYEEALNSGVIAPSQSLYPIIANSAPRQIVASIKTSDGRGGAYTKNYSYKNGMFYNGCLYKRQDLGFEKITETDPGTGITTITKYEPFDKNNPAPERKRWLARLPISIEKKAGVNLIEWQRFDYTDVITPYKTHFARLDSSSVTVYEGSSPLYTKSTSNTYDMTYGNITRSEGNDGTADYSVDITYSIDPIKWIINRPETIKKISGGITVRDDAYAYADNNLVSVTNQMSQTTSYSYDDCGNITSITNPLGNTTTITYDSDYMTFPEEITNANGITVTRKYDAAYGNVISQTDPGDNRTDFEYDSAGRLTGVVNPDGDMVKEILYHDELRGNASAQYIETIIYNCNGVAANTTREYFDGLGRVYKRTSEIGTVNNQVLTRMETFTFGTAGELTEKSIPYIPEKQSYDHMRIRYEYDASKRRIVKEERPDSIIYYEYSAESGLLAVKATDPEGKEYTSRYNSRGQLVKKNEPEGGEISYNYDGAGRLVRTVDAKGNVTIITYDALGRKTSITDPNTGTIYYTYDNGGRLTSKADARGVTVDYTYDNADRVTKADYSDDTPDVIYGYDDTSMVNGKGRLTSVNDGVSTTKFAYDSRGNTSYIRQSVGRLDFVARFEYDVQNRQSALIYPDGTRIDNVYSQAGNLQAVKCGEGAFVQYGLSFDGTGEMQNAVKRYTGDGVETTIGFDPVNNRARAVLSRNRDNETLEDNVYAHDLNGNIISITDRVNKESSQTFTYDDLNRLTRAAGIYGTHEYSYDTAGNLKSNNHGTLAYGDSSHPFAVTADGEGNSYSYDNAGNMIYRKGATLAYDAENRLKSITGGTTDQEYSYDYSGHRVIKKDNDGYITYNFMGIYEVAQALNKNDVHTKYIYGLSGDIVAQITAENAALVTAMNSGAVYDMAYASSGPVAFILRGKIAADEFISRPENIQLLQKILIAIAALSLLSLAVYLRIYCRFETPLMRWSADLSPALIAVLVITFSFTGCGAGIDPEATTGLPTGGTYYFHPDHVGSVSYLTDAAGKLVTRMFYTPYGEKVTGSITGPDIFHKKFTGQEDDGTGLLFYKARYYDPAIGRFISADSMVPDPWYSQAFNRYMYTYGNPVTLNDPSGFYPEDGPGGCDNAIGNPDSDYNPGSSNGDGGGSPNGSNDLTGGIDSGNTGSGGLDLSGTDADPNRPSHEHNGHGNNETGLNAQNNYGLGWSSPFNGDCGTDYKRAAYAAYYNKDYINAGIYGLDSYCEFSYDSLFAAAGIGLFARFIGSVTAGEGVTAATEAAIVTVGESGIQTTAHGLERIAGSAATRGGVLSMEEIKQVLELGKKMAQADGAIVRILETTSGRFNVVITGERGIITTFQNISEKSLGRLGRRYGWH